MLQERRGLRPFFKLGFNVVVRVEAGENLQMTALGWLARGFAWSFVWSFARRLGTLRRG